MRAPKPPRMVSEGRRARGQAAHRQGHRGEWLAALWLMLKGYQILGFRLKTRTGEIDVLARKGQVLAVVEVKRRAEIDAARLALKPHQHDRLIAAGQAVLRQRPSLAGHVLRIDMVALAPGRIPIHVRNVVREGNP